MIIHDCPLSGLKTIQMTKFEDNRGFLSEIFNAKHFRDGGLPIEFAQDNHTRSKPGTLRGLHFQRTPAQGKLVMVLRGKIQDVAVDIRPKSPSYGQHHAIELSDNNSKAFWIPFGFAHGFCVLGDEDADVLYKVTSSYNPDTQGGIRYDDPQLNIKWGIDNPIVSPRDADLPSWQDYGAHPLEGMQ